MDSSKSSSFGKDDSLNKGCNGISNQIGPFKGQSPVVPQPLGSIGAPIVHSLFVPQPMGSTPGHLQVDSSNKGSKYLMSSEPLPNLGEVGFNLIPQENISLRSQDRTSWSSGFTQDLQDNHRMSPSPPQSPIKVSDCNTSNEFQRMFCESRDYVEHVYSLIGSFFDMSQIQGLEQCHREIDSQISKLTPFASQSTEEFNVYEMVKGLRVIQSKIEDKLISYYQNLEERDRMKVVFSLPQLRDHSYISVVNRSVHHSRNNLVNQLNGLSVNESIYQSANRSFSPNSSQNKVASNNFSHVRMSSPNKDESSIPKFSPPVDQNGTFSNLLEANYNAKGQIAIQSNRLDSKHMSAIESPETIHRPLAQPNFENFIPNVGEKPALNIPNVGEKPALKVPNVGAQPALKVPNVGAQPALKVPNVGAQPALKVPNVGAQPALKVPNVGAQPALKVLNVEAQPALNVPNVGDKPVLDVPNVGDKPALNASQSGIDNNRISSNNGVSSKYLASFNIFLKRKNDLEVEVNNLLISAENDQTQPSTLKLKGNDLKSKLTSLKIDKWIEDDRMGYFDPIDLCNWEDRVARDIASVLYKSEDLINLRKGLAQSGIKKREPPKFSGSVLDYPLFKKNWSIEVSPGGLPELIELNHLKDSVPATAKDRLYEVENMIEAWNILDRVYGKEFDLRNKLKQEFLSIKLSAKTSPLIEIELFQKVHKIAARIKAAKAQSLLEHDFDYISLVYQLLPETQRERWVNHASLNPTWDSFYKFLEDVYEKALLKKQINDSFKPTVVKDKTICSKCNRTGHSADSCFAKSKVLVSTLGEPNCPVCKGPLHTWTTKNSTEPFKSKRLSACPKIREADNNAKKQIMEGIKSKFGNICSVCSSWTHKTSDCRFTDVTCTKCGGHHFNDTCEIVKFVSCATIGSSLSKLCVQDIPASVASEPSRKARVLFDLGSQTTLVRDKFAEQAGWSYTTAQYSLAGIGSNSKIIKGKLWNIVLKDREGQLHTTQGYGVPSILKDDWSFPAIKEMAEQFPNVPNEVFLAQESKPLDILIGTDSLNLMPKCNFGPDCKDCSNGLCCYQSKFGLGWVAVGQCRTNTAQNISCPLTFSVCLQKVVPHTRESFFLGEALGTESIPTCSSCRSLISNCKFCSSETALCSAQEELEYRIMKENCKYDASIGHLVSKYPWAADPDILQDNGAAALAFQRKLEARQLKDNTFLDYAKCFQEMIDRNVVSEITPLELQAWKGPINYNTHHDVLKDSVTTPVRLVSNSSFPNGSTTLNDLLVKGPNTLNCLFSNLVRFRGYEIALVGDISKAYNSIKTGQVERHTRRYWFRFSQEEPWKVYGANCVMFGDKPAAGLMTIAVEKASDSCSEVMQLKIAPDELVLSDARKLKADSYVDDLISGGSKSDVARMMGTKDPLTNQFTGTIHKLLNNVGLSLKTLVTSGSRDEEAIAKLSGTALGYKWEPTSDEMGVKLKFNPSKKKKGIKSKPDITLSDLQSFETLSFSKRQIVSLCNGIYDPLGIASPYTIKLKLLIRDCLLAQDRNTLSSKQSWDATIPSVYTSKWVELIREGITQESLTFNRTVRPEAVAKAPSLIGFFDGSASAMAGAIYIRWMCFKDKSKTVDSSLNNGCLEDSDYDPDIHEFKSYLVTAKARVTPLDGLTIPRSELSALQILTRLLHKTVKTLPETPSEVYILGDSTCVISALDKVATCFNPFMHSRISDIHHTLEVIGKQAKVHPIQYIPSKENIADIATRSETLVSSIGKNSIWQLGPHWLSQPKKSWPATRSFIKDEFPETECKDPIRILVATSQVKDYRCPFVINALKSCNDYYDALAKVTKNILDFSSKLASFRNEKHITLNSDASHRAWSLLFEDAMRETDLLFSQGELKNFEHNSRTIEGVNRTIHVTTGRFSADAVSVMSGQTELPILSATSDLARLIVLSAHRIGGHKMTKDTISRTRQIAYIHRPGKLVKSILDNCNLCKIKKEQTSQQLMGKLPSYRICPTPPFQKVSVDLVGHFFVKPTMTSRSQCKVWVLMYLCDVSKALHTEVIDSMSSSSIINAFRSCFALRNTPEQISSDPGKCFVGAKNILDKELGQISQELVNYWPSINWIVHPTEAPWRLGAVEALVKQLKSSFKMLPNFKLTLLEFRTIINEITTSINNRPLGLLEGNMHPLTPNQLLLGRNFNPVAPGSNINADTSLLGLKGYIQDIYKFWWSRWEVEVLPRLFTPGPKWNKVENNVKVGDIGLLLAHKGSAGKILTVYKYIKVLEVIESRDGLVRKAKVQYRIPSLKKKEIIVDIRRLVILPNLNL